MTCPRCGHPLTNPGRSRVTHDRTLTICGPCATDEAVRDRAGLAPVPPGDWPIPAT